MKFFTLLSITLISAASAVAQTAIPTEFPADAVPLNAPDLTARLSEKVFVAKMTDGTDWRYQFKGGYLFFNISSGYSDSGTWRIEGSSLCLNPKKTAASCSEMRSKGELLFIKRASNGEVATLVQR